MNRDLYSNRAEAYEAHDDIPRSPDDAETIGDVILRRYTRRGVISGGIGVAAVTALFGPGSARAHPAQAAGFDAPSFSFDEVTAPIDGRHHLAPGYDAYVLLRWGDPVFSDSPPFDPRNQSAASQLRQFGYNNDYLGLVPLDDSGTRALLCVNHEYTNEEVMFPGVGRHDDFSFPGITPEMVDIEMAAHGGTIIEIRRDGDQWRTVLDSPYNRRISSSETKMAVDGPASGDARLRTNADPDGRTIIGTLNNCAGGMTPWGTWLMAEENFHGYFWTDARGEDGKPPKGLGGDQAASYGRYDVPALWQAWGMFRERFNVDKEPNEPNRFGWIVEVDPLDASSVPVKHTALGRFRHEGAEPILNGDGRVVVYSGDDAKYDYVYRFVSSGRYDPNDRRANMALLSEGTLSVARFDDDGSVTWLPLIYGQGPLTEARGFRSQADVLIDARLAADEFHATRMDRPEDVQPNPKTGKVYVILTNNEDRKPDEESAANPRPANLFGHIVEMTPPDGNHAAERFTWDMLLKCGDPSVADVGALWHADQSQHGWFACPDNCAFDAEGRLWISTDQGKGWPKTGRADGLFAVSTEGDERRLSRCFFRAPVGAEVCGPCFSRDGETLFLAVQHPGTDGTKNFKGFERESTFEDPATRWPDFDPNLPPRPAILAITRTGGGRIG